LSTYLRIKKNDQTITLKDLKDYFHPFAKSPSQYKLGLEWELFGVSPRTGQAIPYFGSSGIETVLRLLAEKFGYETLKEEGRLIALFRRENYVALEPGGQLELSAEPVETVHDVRDQLECFRRELCEIARDIPVSWLTVGFHPFSRLAEIEWVPKKRYEIMKTYLAKKGDQAHDMMKRTAANQVSVDFSSESDAMEKLRVIYGLTSLISALFAHSPLFEGHWDGFLTRRMAVWRQTDSERTGLIPQLLKEDSSFDDYLSYVLDAPMIFIIRDGRWVPMEGVSFRGFLSRGFGDFRATRDDFELHLSTLFPEARLKNCIEIRGADGQLFELIPSVPALWKGILYDAEAREAAWKLVRDFSWEERVAFHANMEKKGPSAHLGNHEGWDLIQEIFNLARAGLQRSRKLNSKGEDETRYLDILFEKVIKPRKTSAEILKEKWGKEFHQNPVLLMDYLKLL